MKKVAIVAHFLSENLGDRYQGTGIYIQLSRLCPSVKIDCINSHPFDLKELEEQPLDAGGNRLAVRNPEKVDWATYSFVIMPTGSLSGDVAFIRWCQQLLASKRLERLVIWGGFHDITDLRRIHPENEPLKAILADERVTFFARGWLELVVFFIIVGAKRGDVGGDPILLNDFDADRSRANVADRRALFVLNGHCAPEFLDQRVGELNRATAHIPEICAVEGVEDVKLIQQIPQIPIRRANSIEEFTALARAASIVVTQRLHALAAAKAASPALPVVVIIPRTSPYKFLKFRSVAASALGFQRPVAHIVEDISSTEIERIVDNPDTYLSREHELNFVEYRRLSFQTCERIADEIRSVGAS